MSINNKIQLFKLQRSILDFEWQSTLNVNCKSLSESLYLQYNASTNIKDYWPNMDISVGIKLFMHHILNKNKILVFGDYDVDGICGSVLLSKFLKFYDANYEIIIPNRFIHGYGLNMDFIDKLTNISLLITVDNGSTAINEIALARNKNIDVLIIDHHTLGDVLPNANFIMNPKLFNIKEIYDLCGTGVAFFFLVEVLKYCKKNNLLVFLELYNLIDIVALATVCDVVSLTYLNRAIVASGLQLIRNKKSYWSELLLSNINNINTETLGFSVGPYINAAGRFGDSITAYEFLYTDNRMEQIKLLSTLFKYNQQRKDLENDIMQEVLNLVKNHNKSVFIYASDNWPEGLLGILSARIKDMLHKPVILFTKINDSQYKGSGRSYEYFHLGHCIQAAKNIIVHGGGHCMAGGLTLNINNYDLFCDFVYKYYDVYNSLLNFHIKHFHSYLSISAIESAYKEVNKFEPYGANFPRPIFCFSNVKVSFCVYIQNKHALFRVSNDIDNTTFIIFNIIRTKFLHLTSQVSFYAHIIGHIQLYNNAYSIQMIDIITL